MNLTKNRIKNPTREEVSVRAAQLWERDGCRSGFDWKYWLQAEKELGAPARPALPKKFLMIACTVSKGLLKPLTKQPPA